MVISLLKIPWLLPLHINEDLQGLAWPGANHFASFISPQLLSFLGFLGSRPQELPFIAHTYLAPSSSRVSVHAPFLSLIATYFLGKPFLSHPSQHNPPPPLRYIHTHSASHLLFLHGTYYVCYYEFVHIITCITPCPPSLKTVKTKTMSVLFTIIYP